MSCGGPSKGDFKPGHKKAAGVARPLAGTKTNAVKQMMNEILYSPMKGASRRSLVELATATLLQAMLDRDEHGNVTPAGERAAVDIWNRAFGKPKQTIDVDVTNRTLIEFVATVQGAAAQSRLLVDQAKRRELVPPAGPTVSLPPSNNGHANGKANGHLNGHQNGSANGQAAKNPQNP